MKKFCLTLFAMFILILSTVFVSSIYSYRGVLHQHTGYSSWNGYDSLPTGGDGCSPLLEFNAYGDTVEQISDESRSEGVEFVGFSDHSYCLDSGEFNVVKNDCIAERNAHSDYTCLVGEELSTQDTTLPENDNEYGCPGNWNGEAHLGSYGLNNFIAQSPTDEHCPGSPTAQGGIDSVNSVGGLSVVNHPNLTLQGIDFYDYQSVLQRSNFYGVEIWNKEWDSDDLAALNVWKKILLRGDGVYAYSGTDSHDGVSPLDCDPIGSANYCPSDFVYSGGGLTDGNILESLKSGYSSASNNGDLLIWVQKSSGGNVQMGREINVSVNEQFDSYVEFNVENGQCYLRFYIGKVGQNSEVYHSFGYVSGYHILSFGTSVDSDSYVRAECISSDGKYRMYSNPIWLNVQSNEGFCGDGIVQTGLGEECEFDNQCGGDEYCDSDCDCVSADNGNYNCNDPNYEWCDGYRYNGCEAEISYSLYDGPNGEGYPNDIRWGTIVTGNEPYVIAQYRWNWDATEADILYYDCSWNDDCSPITGVCNCNSIPLSGSMITETPPAYAFREDFVVHNTDSGYWCTLGFNEFYPYYLPDKKIYVLECYDNLDCSSNQLCNKSGNWQTWSCVNKKSDGQSCLTNDECASGYCDNDGIGLGDDNWCFTPYNSYFDGQENTKCEYSTNLGHQDCDENSVGTGLNLCSGLSYYEQECDSVCGSVDITGQFECTGTGCSCGEPLCDGRVAGYDLGKCSWEESYFADECSSTAEGRDRGDNICRSPLFTLGCTADYECDGVIAGTNGCDLNCTFDNNTFPSDPNRIFLNGLLFQNGVDYSDSIDIKCLGSMDPQGLPLTYFIDAYFVDDESWWKSEWTLRKPITISENSGEDLYGYYVEMMVLSEPGMDSDFSDVRFVDGDRELEYEIYGISIGHRFWVRVKIPFIEADSEKVIYMYYRNAHASTDSNHNTFSEYENLVSFYNLDDSLVRDYISGNNGTNQGANHVSDGKTGESFRFDGTDDYIDLNGNPLGDIGNDDFSVSMWVKVPNKFENGELNDIDVFFSMGGIVGGDVMNFRISALRVFDVYIKDNGGDNVMLGGGDSNGIEEWTLFTLVRQGNVFRLYRNKELLDEEIFSIDFDSTNFNGEAYMGKKSIGANSSFFEGGIDEVGIWDKALGEDEVKKLYNRGNGKTMFVDDEISYSFDLDDYSWSEIGSHDEGGSFLWNIFNLPQQTGVDLKCRAENSEGETSGDYNPVGRINIV